jgi:hypothetical protein
MRAKMAHPGGSKGNGRMSELNARTAIVLDPEVLGSSRDHRTCHPL